MSRSRDDRESEASSDEQEVGWGGREWADRGEGDPDNDRDLDRLIEERPPHHEEHDR